MSMITIQPCSHGVLLILDVAPSQPVLVPQSELSRLVEQLQMYMGDESDQFDKLLTALEPVLGLAYHLSVVTADTVLYRDAHVLLTAGDIQRLALVVHRLSHAGQL